MNMTKEQRIAGHKTFCGTNWRMIASFAWEQYLEKGRGLWFYALRFYAEVCNKHEHQVFPS